MSVAFDTLKFARALRDKANMTSERAEGVAEAFSSATTEQLATKADLAELGAGLNATIADVKSDIRAVIADVKADLRAEIATVKADVLLLKWMIGFVLALLLAIFSKLFLH